MNASEQTAHARKTMLLGVAILAALTILGDVYLIWHHSKTHHGHAVYVPGGIEIYP